MLVIIREYLPCKFAYLDGEIYRHRYHRLWVWEAWIDRDHLTADMLTSQACPLLKDERESSKYLTKLHERYAKDIIEYADIGDKIFCFEEIDGEVVLL